MPLERGLNKNAATLATSSVHGFVLLRLLASLRRWRPRSLRFHEEQAAIDVWLAALREALPRHAGFAAALAELPRLRKGYSDTFDRGRTSYQRIFDTLVSRSEPPDDAAAEALREAITAALAEPEAAAPPPRPPGAAKPIVWHARDSTLTTDATRES